MPSPMHNINPQHTLPELSSSLCVEHVSLLHSSLGVAFSAWAAATALALACSSSACLWPCAQRDVEKYVLAAC